MKIEDTNQFTFLRHYLIAALWSRSDGETESLLDVHGLEDIHPDTIRMCYDLCEDFQEAHKDLLRLAYQFYNESGMSNHPDAGSPQACAGHDFWLTCAHHGVGFWDRGMGLLGDILTEHCKAYRAPDFYVGDDGKVHAS